MSIGRRRQPVVLLYEEIHADAVDLLRAHTEVRIAGDLLEDSIVKAVGDVNAVIVRANGRVSRRVIEAAPRLRIVGRHGAGVENIDRVAAADRGVHVVNTPAANAQAVAEHCLGLMLALSRRLLAAHEAVRQGDWNARDRLAGTELRERTLGIIGFGVTGQRVAWMCHRALDMPVVYADVREHRDAAVAIDARRESLEDVCSTADVVSVHVPLRGETRHLIGRDLLRRMRRTTLLINTARGAVVHQEALIEALQDGWIAGAGLDVFDPEPLDDERLTRLPNVVLSPHMAAHTDKALRRMAMTVAEDVLAVLQGQAASNPVEPPGAST